MQTYDYKAMASVRPTGECWPHIGPIPVVAGAHIGIPPIQAPPSDTDDTPVVGRRFMPNADTADWNEAHGAIHDTALKLGGLTVRSVCPPHFLAEVYANGTSVRAWYTSKNVTWLS